MGAGAAARLAGGFLAATVGSGDRDGVGLGCAAGAAAVVAGAVPRSPFSPFSPLLLPGSGDMMLTGGIEAEDGKSALVGLPVGIDGG